ncbi:MAG: hypothetical protein ACOH17_04395 [Cellulomonas sp.]
MASTGEEWGTELDAVGIPGLVEAVENPMAHLAEAPINGRAGGYWPQAADQASEATRDAAVVRAMEALEGLLAATRDGRLGKKSRTHLLGAVDRALADPKTGYMRRLRQQRSALLRERVRDGSTMAKLAVELGVTPDRVRALLNNNRPYISASRKLALEALRDEGEVRRAQVLAERAAARERAAADRLSARVEEGRLLAARLHGGEARADIMAGTGYSAQKVVGLLAAARKADEEGQA